MITRKEKVFSGIMLFIVFLLISLVPLWFLQFPGIRIIDVVSYDIISIVLFLIVLSMNFRYIRMYTQNKINTISTDLRNLKTIHHMIFCVAVIVASVLLAMVSGIMMFIGSLFGDFELSVGFSVAILVIAYGFLLIIIRTILLYRLRVIQLWYGTVPIVIILAYILIVLYFLSWAML